MRTRAFVALAGVVASCAAAATAQTRVLVNDRNNDSIYVLSDLNGNGVIEEPGEVQLYFSGANASGILGPLNPTCLGVRRDGLTLMGDQDNTRRLLFALRDLDGNHSANEAGEAVVAANASNVSGVSFAFPTGAEFDSRGRLHVVNAGNGFGNDIVVRLVDLNGDRAYMDAGEITEYVAAPFFGPGNGSFSPQEIVFDAADVMYLRNSSSGLHGVWRFEDLDGNGRADDSGEATVFFDSTNASGVTVSAGFAIDLDRARPTPAHPLSLYYHQLASGGVDQIYRLTDLNGDGDANDLGEAVLVFSTAETGFSSIDICSLYDGRVLFSDNSGKRIIALQDLDNDGLFLAANERTDFFANTSLVLGDVRQVNILPCPADWDHDNAVTPSDVAAFVNDWFTSITQSTYAGDFDFSGAVQPADVAAFVTVWFGALGGGC